MTFESNDLKALHGQDDAKKKFTIRSKNILSWVLAVLLVLLVSLVTVQFLYPFTIIERIFLQNTTTPPTEVEKQDVTFSLNPTHLCDSDNGVDLLVLVASKAEHSDRRKMIRQTWGSVANSSGDSNSTIRLAFVVGHSTDAAVAAAVASESATQGDLIRSTDAANVSRAVAMLRWVARHCAEARYFLKAEDDTFVNVGVVAQLLGREPYASHPKFIGGYVVQTYTNEQAPPESEPCLGAEEYISGPSFLTRGPTAADLFQSALALQQQPALEDSFQNEDLFITGLCGRNAGAVLVHEPLFAFEAPSPCSIQDCGKMAAAPGLTPIEMQLLWEAIRLAMLEDLVEGAMYKEELDGLESVPVSIKLLI